MTMMKRAIKHLKAKYVELGGATLDTRSIDMAQAQATLLSQVEGLLEFLEIEDCGSVGGFGYNQGRFSKSIEGRIEYLHCKYVKLDSELWWAKR